MNALSNALNYGMGIFETIKVKDGCLEFLTEHLNRLIGSVETLNLSYNISQETMENELKAYCRDNALTDGVIKLLINDSDQMMTITHRRNPYDDASYHQGFKLSVSDIKRHSSNPLWQHKTTNYWLNIMVKKTAEEYEEILFLNEDNEITEGCVSNVFLVKNNCIKTPPLSCGLLAGVMRNQVIKQCASLNIDLSVECFTSEDLLDAEGIFISNSVMGIMPVTTFLGLPKGISPVVTQLMEVLNGREK